MFYITSIGTETLEFDGTKALKEAMQLAAQPDGSDRLQVESFGYQQRWQDLTIFNQPAGFC